jgi:hypothetical protein
VAHVGPVGSDRALRPSPNTSHTPPLNIALDPKPENQNIFPHKIRLSITPPLNQAPKPETQNLEHFPTSLLASQWIPQSWNPILRVQFSDLSWNYSMNTLELESNNNQPLTSDLSTGRPLPFPVVTPPMQMVSATVCVVWDPCVRRKTLVLWFDVNQQTMVCIINLRTPLSYNHNIIILTLISYLSTRLSLPFTRFSPSMQLFAATLTAVWIPFMRINTLVLWCLIMRRTFLG